MAPIGMGYANQSAPLRELERLILEKQLIHEGDVCCAGWCAM